MPPFPPGKGAFDYMITIICKKCGKPKEVFNCRAMRTKYCSKECYWSDMKGRMISEVARKNLSKALMGHPGYWLGKKKPKEITEKIRKKLIGEKCYAWKGKNAKYSSIHQAIYTILGQPETCEHCGKSGLKGHKIHWANKSGLYLRIASDWLRLCVKCHRAYDRKNKIEYSPTPLASSR